MDYYIEIRRSVFWVLLRIVSLEFVVLIASLILMLVEEMILGTSNMLYTQENIILLIGTSVGMGVINIVLIIVAFLKWSTDYYILEGRNVVFRKGIWQVKEQVFSIENVETASVQQSFWGRVFNFGSLDVYNPVLKSDLHLYGIPSPSKYLEIIQQIGKGDKPGLTLLRIRR